MIGGIFAGILSIVHQLIQVYIWVIIIAALLTWVRPDPTNPIVQILYRLTEPAYTLVRRYVPTVLNGIDLAPIIIIVALQVIDVILINVIRSIAF